MRHGEKKLFLRGIALLLSLSLALGCAGCGGTDSTGMSASAATMFLRKTEGAVTVSDAEGQSVEPAENLGLYSGYGVGTEAESFAWIDLDKVKLAKLDEYSEAAISKDGKNLSIEIQSGSLFFNVTEPLADDETMEIRTSSMMVGIRGTCGWVETPENDAMCVYILEGAVECTAGEKTATVRAGEMAAMTEDGQITVEPFYVEDVPAFVSGELEADEALNKAVIDASGLDVTDPLQAYADILAEVPGEIVLAEEIDFEADGSPELLVLYLDEGEFGQFIGSQVFRHGTRILWSPARMPLGVDGNHESKLSLVESGGRQYLMVYWGGSQWEGHSTFKNEEYSYYGSVAQSDGDSSFWGRVDGVLYTGRDDSPLRYQRFSQSENGLRGGAMVESSVEEYESVISQYTEVRVLYRG